MLLITGVLQDGPASRGGLRPGDVVVQIDGRDVRSTSDLFAAVSTLQPGSTARVGVQRGSQVLALELTVVDRPALRREPR